jgi:hypothetical protein
MPDDALLQNAALPLLLLSLIFGDKKRKTERDKKARPWGLLPLLTT